MDTEVVPVNHHALVKISDQPSFSSANISPFTSAEALRASHISPVPSLNLRPNPRNGTVKKIMSTSNRKFVGVTQKKKSNRSLNPKPIGLLRMLFLVLQNDGTE